MTMDVQILAHVLQTQVISYMFVAEKYIKIYIIKSLDGCTAFCPTVCPPNLETCPGGTDVDGCPIPDFCFTSSNFGNDGSECAIACPVPCVGDQLFCFGVSDSNGCPMPNTCVENQGNMFITENNNLKYTQNSIFRCRWLSRVLSYCMPAW